MDKILKTVSKIYLHYWLRIEIFDFYTNSRGDFTPLPLTKKLIL